MPKTAKKDKVLNTIQLIITNKRNKTQNERIKDEYCLGKSSSEDLDIEMRDVHIKFKIQEHENKCLFQAEMSTTLPLIKSEEFKITIHQPPEGEGEIGCDECDKFFKTNKTYHIHLDMFHHFQEYCKPNKNDPSWYCKAGNKRTPRCYDNETNFCLVSSVKPQRAASKNMILSWLTQQRSRTFNYPLLVTISRYDS